MPPHIIRGHFFVLEENEDLADLSGKTKEGV